MRRDLVVVVVGIAVGAAVVVAAVGGWPGSDPAAAGPLLPAAGQEDVEAAEAAAEAALDADVAAAAGDADGPLGADAARGAVEGFLAAEVEGRVPDAWRYLTPTDRARFGSAAAWTAAHADLFPPVTGHDTGAVDRDGDTAQVTGTVAFEPGLDRVLGLTPAAADATWVVTRDEAGRWGIDLEATTIAPRWPDDDAGARAAAEGWARSRQRCAPAGEWDGGLLGTPALAERLCDARGAVVVGDVAPLADADATDFGAAFGPAVTAWARVVEITAPEPVRAVLAPVGDRWRVIGVLPGG